MTGSYMTWHIPKCYITHSYMWHHSFLYVCNDSFACDMAYQHVTCLIYAWHFWFLYVTWLIPICDMKNSCRWHHSFLYVTWLIHMRHDSFIYVTWLIHTWHDSYIRDMTHLHVTWLIHLWHVSVIHDKINSYPRHYPLLNVALLYIYEWVMSHMNESCHI